MATPGDIPKAKPIITEHLLQGGASVDLTDKVTAIDEHLERAYVRSRTNADKAKLKTNYEAWLNVNENKNEAVNVKQLLESLKTDIDTPDAGMQLQPAVGLNTAEKLTTSAIEKTIGLGSTTAIDGLKKIPEYARDEYVRFSNADTTERKIGIAGKNALLLGAGYGLFRLYNWMTSGIDKSAETGGLKYYAWHALKWTGLLALTGWGANMMLGKNATSATPGAAPTKAIPALTKAKERTAIETRRDMRTVPQGENLLSHIDIDDATKTEKKLTLTVDREVVTILPPVNDHGHLDVRIVIGGATYSLAPKPEPATPPPARDPSDVLGIAMDKGKELMKQTFIEPHRRNDKFDGRGMLATAKQYVSISRLDDTTIRISSILGALNADVAMNDIASRVRQIRDGKTEIELPLTFARKRITKTFNVTKND